MRLFRYVCFLAVLLPFATSAQDSVKRDTEKPVEITADALEVLQKEQQAIFKGNVVATQGDMRLSAETMKVFYRTGEQAKGDAQAVSKIEVQGNVFLATPDESARGKSGLYNVDDKKITLKEDVVLTRGENVVKGQVLEYDLVTGRSRIVGAGEVGSTSKEGDGGKKGRVRGLFVPQNNGK